MGIEQAIKQAIKLTESYQPYGLLNQIFPSNQQYIIPLYEPRKPYDVSFGGVTTGSNTADEASKNNNSEDDIVLEPFHNNVNDDYRQVPFKPGTYDGGICGGNKNNTRSN